MLRVISSMATRHLLGELTAAFTSMKIAGGPDPGALTAPAPWGGVVRPTTDVHSTADVSVVSMGGVEAAKLVAAGEPFDAAVLAAGAIERLIAQGHLLAGSRVDIVKSPMAVAIRAGATRPAIHTEDAVREAVVAAERIGYSTGPSGDHLMALLERWGMAASMKERLVQARPGVPVASLVASGEVTLGFQQLSEMLNVDGVHVLGLLPDAIQGTTTFAGGVVSSSSQVERVRALLAFMSSPAVDGIKRRHGMQPAR